jgi:hypothetical protein
MPAQRRAQVGRWPLGQATPVSARRPFPVPHLGAGAPLLHVIRYQHAASPVLNTAETLIFSSVATAS